VTPEPATRAVRAGIACETQHGAVVPPIHLSSTFTFAGFDRPRTYDYSRSGNPTRDLAAQAIADLEGGAGAVVTASGMAAVTLALQLLRSGDTVVAAHDAYGGTYRLLKACAARGHFDVAFGDLSAESAPGLVRQRRPRMVWIETPSNPLLRVTDIARIQRDGESASSTGGRAFGR
jgi:cystathionine gamma-synthase